MFPETQILTDEMSSIDYIKVILKRKWFILSLFFLAVILTGIFSFLLPKVYQIDTSLEVGRIDGVVVALVEDPGQVKEKIDSDVYGVLIREKLQISEENYPKIKAENPKNTNLIKIKIESANTQQSLSILEEINKIISEEHQEKLEFKKELLEKDIEFLENNIEVAGKGTERVKTKIGFLEEEKKNLEAKVEALQKILPYQQDPGTQFALFDTKEKLAQKKLEIEDRYLGINSLETEIGSFKSQINSLQKQIKDIWSTQIIKTPTVSKNPIKPRLLFNVAVAGFLGLFSGIFLAFGKEWWEKESLQKNNKI
ncbi:hypothetical protein KKE19_00620 [Patescibacteria group bacterium]|nr:hypothetical protein [Patescibacteria group bacterium]MBU4367588.1 hypothetical protein [Patescibacteria group bacterium]MBU4461628.1 hypothetical protein [Patescibacteria group bacterium]MCG2699526.1 hypothetical protein [Candidatus Parcubacteria bacterium]